MASVIADPWLLPAALAVEACIGYPQAVYARIAHPVVWIGRLIEYLERRWNVGTHSDPALRVYGIITVAIIVGLAALAGYLLQRLAIAIPFGMAIIILAATTGLAQRALYDHVNDVLRPLLAGDLAAARIAVGRIVGRDTAALGESDVAAAALESLAESFNDGIVAPAFWLLLGGLPGLFAYKAINTADSLIGHLEPRWRMFGWAAARSDDAVNLVPARIAGVLLVIAGGGGLRVMWRDASKHPSPNAGWPEAAMAGSLKIHLGGPSRYDGLWHGRPTFGVGIEAQPRHLRKGLLIYIRACVLSWLAALAVPAVALLS
ncbi:MAG TPA: adenosylcobinamide-phosphate synthase CbiB [Steroidobacteraceae bacterium]|jgi:adenosylcobinamide-phosphate synthase